MRTAARIILSSVALSCLFLSARRVEACSCVRERPTCAAFGSATAVFVGKVVGAKEQREYKGKDGVKKVFDVGEIYFQSEETFLGVKSPRVVIHSGTGGGDCGYWFERGKRYLVYAYGDSPKSLGTNICTRTRSLDDAEEDLTFLRSLPRQGVGARIYGQVVEPAKDPPSKERRAPKPLAGIVVKAEGRRSYEAATDAEGKYELAGLEPGVYKVRAVLPEYYYTDEFSVRDVKVNDRGCAEERFFAQNDSRIRGRVLQPDGRGSPKAMVAIVPVDSSDKMSWTQTDHTWADENGYFEFGQIPPGRYLIGTNIGESPDSEHPYPRTFYPGVTERSQARVIEVGLGQKLKDLDIQLPAPLTEGVVSGAVTWLDGRPAAHAEVYLEDVNYPGWCVNGCSTRADAQGRFALRGFVGYTYRVEASAEKTVEGKRQRMRADSPTLTLAGDPVEVKLVLSVPDKDDPDK